MSHAQTSSVLRDIERTTDKYKTAHLLQASRLRDMYNTLTLIGLFIGPLTGIVAEITKPRCGDQSIGSTIMVLSLGMLSGIVSSMIKFGKFDEVSAKNKTIAVAYSSIVNNIRIRLSMGDESDEDSMVYIKWIQDKFDQLFEEAPLLPESVYQNAGRRPSFTSSIRCGVSPIEMFNTSQLMSPAESSERRVIHPESEYKGSLSLAEMKMKRRSNDAIGTIESDGVPVMDVFDNLYVYDIDNNTSNTIESSSPRDIVSEAFNNSYNYEINKFKPKTQK